MEVLNKYYSRHLRMLDEAIKSTKRIKESSLREDVDSLTIEAENRDRVLNIIAYIQAKIENFIDQNIQELAAKQAINNLKKWQDKASVKYQEIECLDAGIIEILENSKSELLSKISNLFRSKEKLKGYNLKELGR